MLGLMLKILGMGVVSLGSFMLGAMMVWYPNIPSFAFVLPLAFLAPLAMRIWALGHSLVQGKKITSR